MLEKSKFKKLHQLGIVLWQPRIKPGVQCLVLVYAHETLDQKILNGMLSVLELNARALKVLTLDRDSAEVQSQIDQIQPNFILQLSMDMPLMLAADRCVRTYSPAYLAQHPEFKKQAYKDLLTLRAQLHGTT